MFFAHLNGPDIQAEKFSPAHTTSNQKCQHRVVLLLRRSSPLDLDNRFLLWSAVSQSPTRTPIRRTLFTRRMPAANSGLRSPESAASYATRRTASSLRLIVVGQDDRSSRSMYSERPIWSVPGREAPMRASAASFCVFASAFLAVPFNRNRRMPKVLPVAVTQDVFAPDDQVNARA